MKNYRLKNEAKDLLRTIKDKRASRAVVTMLERMVEKLVAALEDADLKARQEDSYRDAYGAMVNDWNEWVGVMRSYGIFISSRRIDSWDWEVVRDGQIVAGGSEPTIARAHAAALQVMLLPEFRKGERS